MIATFRFTLNIDESEIPEFVHVTDPTLVLYLPHSGFVACTLLCEMEAKADKSIKYRMCYAVS